MRKPIEINSRVAARRGPFEPAALGRVRQQRALKFGNVVESVANNKFRIRWDDGTESCETTNVLKLQPTGAGALPQSAAGSAGCSAASAATSSRATPGYDVFSPRAAIGYDGDDPNVDCDDPKELYYETPEASEEVVNESGGADSDDEQEGLGGQDLPLDCPVQSLLVEPITGTPYTVILSTTGAGRQTVTWTVCGPDYDPPITTEDRAADLMRAAGGEATGLRGGLPYRDGALDLLALWLKLYPGDVVQDLEKLNDYALRTRTTFRPVTKSESVPWFSKFSKFSKAAPGAGPDTWQMFTQMVEDFNRNRMMMLVMGVWITFDEAMSAYQPRSTKTGGLPNISFIKRKPKPLGTEGKTACDCATGVMIHFEIEEGRDAMRLKEHAPELGVTAACTLRMAERSAPAGATVLGDSWFASVKAAVAVGKTGRHFIGCVKTSHSLYPKAYLESHLKDKPAGSRMVLRSTVEGVGLMAIGYKYNRRRVLFFLATEGAGGVHDGEPYVQRWADDLNNITTRHIPRPDVVSQYFARSPRVDNHNQSRQHDLMLEELWLTQDCWFRLHTTMAGIHVTDCWKLAKHHLPRHHPLKESTAVNFADLMCKALIYNGLTGEVEPTRRTERVLADITNEPPPLPHSIMHLGKRPGNDNATKQARCTMCRVDDDNVGWTSYKCPDCDIPLCIPSKRRKGVACWTRHRRMTAQQLAVYGVNRRAD
eukprot:jgi/Tetstr1/448797/TSEL_036031.t1